MKVKIKRNVWWSICRANITGAISKKKIGYLWEIWLVNHDDNYPYARGRALSFKRAMEKWQKEYDALPKDREGWEIAE